MTPTFQFPSSPLTQGGKTTPISPFPVGLATNLGGLRGHCKLPRNLALHIEDFLPPAEIRRNKHGRFGPSRHTTKRKIPLRPSGTSSLLALGDLPWPRIQGSALQFGVSPEVQLPAGHSLWNTKPKTWKSALIPRKDCIIFGFPGIGKGKFPQQMIQPFCQATSTWPELAHLRN